MIRRKLERMTPSPWREWLAAHQPAPAPVPAPAAPVGREPSGKDVTAYRDMLEGLGDCTFRPASYEKRFVRDMRGWLDSGEPYELSVKQAALIEQLYHRYRRQIPDHAEHCVICQAKTPG